MNSSKKYFDEHIALLRFKEDFNKNQKLQHISLFSNNNIHSIGKITKIILNFSFKNIDFNKKKALSFFLAVELLTNQKCIATLSSKNVLSWKLRKGMLVGCKVTLRSKNLFEFIDNLNLSLPRIEKFNPIKIQKADYKINHGIITTLSEIFFFYPIELGLGINTDVKKMDVNIIFNIKSREEKIFLLKTNKIPTKI